MNFNPENRIALVTGSTRGLGKIIAEVLAEEGIKVIVNGRSVNAESVAQHKNKQNMFPGPADVTKTDEIKTLFDGTVASLGRLDILVNNAGNIEKFGSFETLQIEDWFRSFDITFMSMVRLVSASLKYLRQSDQARIINIASLPAHQPGQFNPHYSAAKAAMLNLTKHLSNYLGKDQITVNAICPSTLTIGGWNQNIIDRACQDQISVSDAETLMRQEESGKSPLGRIGSADDVANLVVFLASSKANFLTGHCYNVDGGITRSVC